MSQLARFDNKETTPVGNPIDLVIAIDDNYCLPGVVMLTSALENLQTDQPVRVFALAGDLGWGSRNKLRNCVSSFGATLTVIDCAGDELIQYARHQNRNLHYISAAPAAKLSLDRLLPEDVSRVIMLDCDMVIRGNLAELWATDLHDQVVGAALDGYYPCIGLAEPVLADRYTLNDSTPYFNSGVMLIDMHRWRQNNVSDACWAMANRCMSDSMMQDQTVFNLVVRGQFQLLHPKWNSIKALMCYASARVSPYPSDELTEAINNPAIVHYVGTRKPWLAGCRHPWRMEFVRYLAKTPFSNHQIDDPGWIKSWLEDMRAIDLPAYRFFLNRRRLSRLGIGEDVGFTKTLWAFIQRVLQSPRILIAPVLYPLLWICSSAGNASNRPIEDIEQVGLVKSRDSAAL